MIHKCYVFGKPNTQTAYVSINADYLPTPPSTNTPSTPIFRLLQPQFLYDDFHYLAFVPQQPEHDGPLFGRLNPLAGHTEESTSSGRTSFRLASHQTAQWKALEAVTCKLRRCLVDRAGGVYLETVFPPLPSSFGYADPWPTRQRLEAALTRARAAFTIQFALISFLLFKEKAKDRSTWEQLGEGDNAIPLAYCNAFRVSWLADFSVPRIGGFVDITRAYRPELMCMWHEDIDYVLANGNSIPLWFAFHGRDTRRQDLPALPPATLAIAKKVIPDHDLVTLVQLKADVEWRLDNEDRTRPLTENASYTVSHVPVGHEELPTRIIFRRRAIQGVAFRMVKSGSAYEFVQLQEAVPSHSSLMLTRFKFRHRQNEGESFMEFMTRSREEQTTWKSRESEDECAARLHREKKYADQPVPTGGSPAVYLWKKQQGLEMRTLVHPKNVNKVWADTQTSDRYYNPLRHEFDVNMLAYATEDPTDESASSDGVSSREEDVTRGRRQVGRAASPRSRRSENSPERRRSRTPPNPRLRAVDDPSWDAPFQSYQSLQDSLQTLLAIETIHETNNRLAQPEAFTTMIAKRYGFFATRSTEGREDAAIDMKTCVNDIRRALGEKVDDNW